MTYKITVKRKVLKGIEKMPAAEQVKLVLLIDDLAASGPIQRTTANSPPPNTIVI